MNTSVFKINVEIYWLIVLSIVALFFIHFLQLDFVIADWIYQPMQSWFYQDYWVTNLVIHRLGKYALILLYLYFLVKFFMRNKNHEDALKRRARIVLLINIVVGTACVSILKHSLNVDCPWDLLQYGGDKPYFAVFHYDAAYLPSSHCFPSGHASTAFTWMALYFYSTMYCPKYRFRILTAILIIGFGFGFSQQLRGAHFISHDIWSLLVCISVNILIYKIAFWKTSTHN